MYNFIEKLEIIYDGILEIQCSMLQVAIILSTLRTVRTLNRTIVRKNSIFSLERTLGVAIDHTGEQYSSEGVV